MEPLQIEAIESAQDSTYEPALEEWLGVLSRLWVAYDKPIDPVRLALYQNLLSRVPLGLLDLAVARVISDHEYNTVPTVAEVWKAVRRELHEPSDIYAAIDAWQAGQWARCVYRFEPGVAVETVPA